MTCKNSVFRHAIIVLLFFVLQNSILYSKPNVLLVHFATKYWGGVENHTLNRYKMLLKHGYNANILVDPQSAMESKLKQLGLPSRPFSKKPLQDDIYNACKELNIDIVMCPSAPSIIAAKKVARKIPIKIIGVRHMPVRDISILLWKNLDGVIGVSPEIADFFRTENTTKNLNIKNIVYIPPFFDAEKFHNFSATNMTQESKKEYFLRRFNLDIDNKPILCMIGNMYDDLLHKNHPLLLEAVQKLVLEKNKPIHVMLAGSGDRQEYLEKLSLKLGIQKYVHFLGFVSDIPELLFHSDFHVLTSSHEAFGQVHIEAGLMKKASIGATKTGATAVIIPEHTGLLFNNGDKDDLVAQLEKLIDNPEHSQQLGKNGYDHVLLNFSNTAQFEKLESLFNAMEK